MEAYIYEGELWRISVCLARSFKLPVQQIMEWNKLSVASHIECFIIKKKKKQICQGMWRRGYLREKKVFHTHLFFYLSKSVNSSKFYQKAANLVQICHYIYIPCIFLLVPDTCKFGLVVNVSGMMVWLFLIYNSFLMFLVISDSQTRENSLSFSHIYIVYGVMCGFPSCTGEKMWMTKKRGHVIFGE